MALTIRERTTSLYQFLIRLVGVVGESLRSEMRQRRTDVQVVFGLLHLSACVSSIGRTARYQKW